MSSFITCTNALKLDMAPETNKSQDSWIVKSLGNWFSFLSPSPDHPVHQELRTTLGCWAWSARKEIQLVLLPGFILPYTARVSNWNPTGCMRSGSDLTTAYKAYWHSNQSHCIGSSRIQGGEGNCHLPPTSPCLMHNLESLVATGDKHKWQRKSWEPP